MGCGVNDLGRRGLKTPKTQNKWSRILPLGVWILVCKGKKGSEMIKNMQFFKIGLILARKWKRMNQMSTLPF